jgi:aspartate/methionine/tyrosine aminotransferase
MLIVLTPHNPTGSVLREEDLIALASLACERNLLVLADEIYENLVYDSARHFSIGRLPNMRERTLTVNGFSKAYSMTGWRLGYIAGPRELMDVLIRVHQYTTVCATSFAQSGAVAAYRGPQECVEEMRLEFARRRKLILECLEQMPRIHCVRPEGAFYVFPSVREFGRPSEVLAMHLLEDGLIATVPGSAFGPNGEGYLRLAYSNSRENIEEAMERMQQSLARL